ncbi:phage head completion protein [Roseovarius salis]|uniref:head-tail adaptor protein n=1 Tax=Roseovarius salis TaxID=3376063 RepID=UPI0037C7BABB
MAMPRLNRQLMLEEASRVPDGAGGWQQSWAVLGTLWADIDARTGRDTGGEGAHLSAMRYRIVVRAAPRGAPSRPRPGQRFRDGDRIFAIMAVAEQDAGGRYLTCFAEEELAL